MDVQKVFDDAEKRIHHNAAALMSRAMFNGGRNEVKPDVFVVTNKYFKERYGKHPEQAPFYILAYGNMVPCHCPNDLTFFLAKDAQEE